MIAIICMCMIVYTAKPEIQKMGGNNQDYGRDQQPGFIMNKKLFNNQEYEPGRKYDKWQQTVMMFFITMIQGIGPYA
jgi:hypothetical protein